MSQPPSGPYPEGNEPPAYGPPPGPQPYGPQPYGPPPYGPGYGPQSYGPDGPQPYGPPPYGSYPPPYGPPPRRSGRGLVVGLVAGLAVLAVCVAVTAVLILRDDAKDTKDAKGRPAALPGGVTATTGGDGTVTMAKSGVQRPVVDVYEDFQCPACKEFDQVNDATLKSLAAQGQAKVVYHPIVIFSEEPLAGNSLRAAAAAHCVDDGARWLAFQGQLFAHQPAEGSAGFSVADLLAYGRTAGLTGDSFTDCVRKQRYAAQVRQETEAATGAGGVTGTPTVKVNGTALPSSETLSAEGLRSAVVAAR